MVVARCSCKGCGLGNSSLIVVVVLGVDAGVVGNRFWWGWVAGGRRWVGHQEKSDGLCVRRFGEIEIQGLFYVFC